MRQRPFILLALVLSLAGTAISVRTQDRAGTPAPASDKPQPPPAKTPVAAPDAGPAPTEEPTKPGGKPSPTKPHHVITNDDLEKGDLFGSPALEIDLSGLDDCDHNCFDYVRFHGGALVDAGGQWKRDLLRSIDKVNGDAKWQAMLAELARVKSKACRVSRERDEALANNADPKNVTEAELSIEEEYDRKYKVALRDEYAALGDVEAAIRNYSGIVVPFMQLQKLRVSGASCMQPQPTRYRPPYQPQRYSPPDDRNDP